MVLYSERTQSRVNTPVNICIGALIIKELFQLSDDELVEGLMLDIRYQYALHTTSFAEQPLSDKSLSRFRNRCYKYETLYGVDLLHDCITGLSRQIAKIMEIIPKIRRMMGTGRFRQLARIRNGVETIPSMLRRIYGADRMAVSGLIKNRLYFGCKVAALNVRKLFTFRSGRDIMPQIHYWRRRDR